MTASAPVHSPGSRTPRVAQRSNPQNIPRDRGRIFPHPHPPPELQQHRFNPLVEHSPDHQRSAVKHELCPTSTDPSTPIVSPGCCALLSMISKMIDAVRSNRVNLTRINVNLERI